jgi:hypothetical protein
MAKPARAPEPIDLVPVSVRISHPGVHLEGNLASVLHVEGEGLHRGYNLLETTNGVVASKEGCPTKLVPWSMVRDVEYASA